MRLLNYIRRLFGTALSFMLFGLGGLCLTLLVFPVINVIYTNPEKRTRVSRKIIHKTFRFFINMMSAFGLFDFIIDQAEKALQKSHGNIIIANHPSLIDIVVLIAILPHADCIVKQSLWDNPFLKGVVRAAGYIRNDNDIDSLMNRCKKSLSSGYSLVIFPEGTRTKNNGILKLHRGASQIALRCNADIIPVTICCTPSTLTKNEPWYSIPECKADFSVSVGNQIKIFDYTNKHQNTSVSARQLTNHIKQYLNKERQNHA